MNEIVYKVESFEQLKNSGYFYQKVSGRKLTGINHRHDFYEILIVLKGEISHVINNENKYMKEREFIILSPEFSHYFSKQSEDVNIFCLSIRKDNFIKIFSNGTIFNRIYSIKGNDLIEDIKNFENTKYYEIILKELCIEIEKESCFSDKFIPYNLVQAVIDMNKPENLSYGVKKFADILGYSTVHLARLTKKYYNKTPYKILFDIKISKAIYLLTNSSLNIEEIAESTGFSSISRFHKVFKDNFNITPFEYRKKYFTQKDTV